MPPTTLAVTPGSASASVRRRRFAAYNVGVGAMALLALTAAVLATDPRPWISDEVFWVLAGLCVLGEGFPIRLTGRAGFDEVTVSTAFAFAVLLYFGALPAMLLFGAATLIVDAPRRHPSRVAFNVAQYVVSIAAAGAVLAVTSGSAGPYDVVAHLPAVVLAAIALFAVNHVLAGVAAAILTNRAVLPYLASDLGFHAWAAGFQLALAPVLVACAQVNAILIPLVFLPMLAIFFGGREAVANQHRALHDDLTDLPNRQSFTRQVAHEIMCAKERGAGLVVMIADLEDFKSVNDSLGHELGDRLLREVSVRLRAAAPADAIVARLGGDEFALLVPDTDTADAVEVAHRMLGELEAPFEADSFSLDVRARFGMAAYPQHGADAHVLLKHADLALHRAKSLRTPCEPFPDHEVASFDRLALAAELRRGIDRGELVLHYQPKLSLSGDKSHGVEALVRWQHPHLGLLSPEGFIPLAEQSNLIKPLTRWVLAEALTQCAAWRRQGLDLRVAVNLSTRSLLDRGLPAEVAELLAARALPASMLQLEVTETKIVADFGRAREVLRDLQAAGVRVAIDDFGTGYSSLAQLQQLPADELKIDKSFVMDMDTNGNNAAIVRSTIGLARNLALDVTAEGVETPETRDRLVELGCDYAQGYLLGRPATADACERDIREHMARPRFARTTAAHDAGTLRVAGAAA